MPDGSDSNGRRPVAVQLRPADIARLDELAREAGMKRASIAAALIEELLPSITGVRRRLQIVRKEPPR